MVLGNETRCLGGIKSEEIEILAIFCDSTLGMVTTNINKSNINKTIVLNLNSSQFYYLLILQGAKPVLRAEPALESCNFPSFSHVFE